MTEQIISSNSHYMLTNNRGVYFVYRVVKRTNRDVKLIGFRFKDESSARTCYGKLADSLA